MHTIPELIITDLDGTLTPSKSPLLPIMIEKVVTLLSKGIHIAVISGGSFEQFEAQILAPLAHSDAKLENLFLLPTNGTMLYRWNKHVGTWHKEYDTGGLSATEKEQIRTAFEHIKDKTSFPFPQARFGVQLEDRGTQMTFSPLGQNAPHDEKEQWDPSGEKRLEILTRIRPLLPTFSIHSGGITSIDINQSGVDKASGLNLFFEKMKFNKATAVFFGDAFSADGNDFPVTTIGIQTIPVRDPDDLSQKLEMYLSLVY